MLQKDMANAEKVDMGRQRSVRPEEMSTGVGEKSDVVDEGKRGQARADDVNRGKVMSTYLDEDRRGFRTGRRRRLMAQRLSSSSRGDVGALSGSGEGQWSRAQARSKRVLSGVVGLRRGWRVARAKGGIIVASR